jgi:hypothetical protein
MNKTLQIFYIYADDCHSCEKILGWLDEITAKHNIPVQMLKFRFDDKVALNIAIKNNIDDLPGIVIGAGSSVFKGKNISKEDIEASIVKEWNKSEKA